VLFLNQKLPFWGNNQLSTSLNKGNFVEYLNVLKKLWPTFFGKSAEFSHKHSQLYILPFYKKFSLVVAPDGRAETCS
jgi:hypothetical protein